jgi:predicted ATP-dependent protease
MPRRHDVSALRVGQERLDWRADPSIYGFRSTADIEPIEITVGQDRAVKALGRGLGLTGRGFNIFANGVVGVGKTTTVARLVRALAPARPRPPDRVYVHNYPHPLNPRSLTLPPGAGLALSAALAQATQAIWTGLQSLIRNNEVRAGGHEVVIAALEPVRRSFGGTSAPAASEVRKFIGQVQNDLLGFLHAVVGGVPDPLGLLRVRLDLAEVNVLADRGRLQGAPVLVENYPTHQNLFGTIEPSLGPGGAAGPGDVSTIRAGSLILADGGFLILHARDLLAEPRAWEDLKRFLRSGELSIRSEGTRYAVPVASIKPESLALNVKVILVGDPRLYQDLYDFDPDFRKVFKITADFDAVIPRSPDNLAGFAQLAARVCRDEGLNHLDPEALAELVTYGARRADGRGKMAAELSELADVIREASFISQGAGRTVVGGADIRTALQDRRDRASLVEEKFQEMLREGAILLDTTGAEVGRVNGLSIYDFGYHRFGKPTRITASVAPGEAGIISIEREAHLSGNIYDKGVLVIAGYLRRRFSRHGPLAITGSLAFEQSYAGVDGDSASVGEVAALLSEIARLPILQGIAVTGSINQHGEVQPVGGVNEKIEGFHALCKVRGLDGEHGVVIPERNLRNLVLHDDVAADIRAGRFHLWFARTVDDALEILFDLPREEIDTRIRAGLTELRHNAEASPAKDLPPTSGTIAVRKPALPGTEGPRKSSSETD